MELQPILHVWLNHDQDLVDLTLTTTRSEHGHNAQQQETLHTNERHPFLTREKGFIPVSQLKPGMHVRRADGSYGIVAKLVVVPGAKWMYNLTVAQDHTYAVGLNQWIVHNIDCDNTLNTLLSDSANQPFNDKYTLSGMAFLKHSSRDGGDAIWGKYGGSPSSVNARGADFIDQVLNGEDTNWRVLDRGNRYSGPVLDGILPDGRGARWLLNDALDFIGFLDP